MEAEIVPWFLSFDSLEQLFSWLRVGRYEGRRTNLDYLTVVQGAGKSNQNYAMDGEGLHLLEPTIAHTRGGVRTTSKSATRRRNYHLHRERYLLGRGENRLGYWE